MSCAHSDVTTVLALGGLSGAVSATMVACRETSNVKASVAAAICVASSATVVLAGSPSLHSTGTLPMLPPVGDISRHCRRSASICSERIFLITYEEQLAALALRHRVLAISQTRAFAAAGGLSAQVGCQLGTKRGVSTHFEFPRRLHHPLMGCVSTLRESVDGAARTNVS